MSWSTDDGQHEGYLAAVFADGFLGGGHARGRVLVTTDAEGRSLGLSNWQNRSVAEVVGWVVVCRCAGSRDETWRGMLFERVDQSKLDDPAEGRLFAPGDEALSPATNRADLERLAVASWRGHILNELHDAAEAVAQATRTLYETVWRMRDAGASWADIGRAVGMTRQSARERWGTTRN
jgi:hypothetical protein